MIAVHSAKAAETGEDKAFWIDLCDPTDEEENEIADRYGVKMPTRAQLDEIESSSRLQKANDALYLSMPLVVHRPDGTVTPTPVGYVLTPKILITIRFAELQAFKMVQERLEKEKDEWTGADVFLAMMESFVDYGADLLERIGADIAGISHRVFHPYTPRQSQVARSNRALREMLISVGSAGERLSEIRDTLLALQRIIIFAGDTAKDEVLPTKICARMETAKHDIRSLTDYEAHYSSKVQFLLDAILGFLNTEQNDVFRVLTIVSVVGIPPTLLASMYGMNFHYMPELSWHYGYAYGLGVIALSAVLPMAWFKWRGWW